MNIALLVPSLLNKAPIIVARELAIGLTRLGVAVTVFYLDEKRELAFPCPTRRLRLRALKELQGFDLVHSHMLRPDLIVGFLRAIKFLRMPCVTTIHNIVEEDLGFSYGKLVGTVAAHCWRGAWPLFSSRIVLTDSARRHYLKSQPKLSFKVISNGRSVLDCDTISREDEVLIGDLKARYVVVGCVAGVSAVKGLDQVVRVLTKLPKCAFLIIGDGPALPSLLALSSELEVRDRVHSFGYRANARAYLRHIDCYLMPSRSEGMPLALIEAGLAARPIVCSEIPAHRSIFPEEEVVFFDLDSIEGLAQAIQIALDNSERYGRAAYRRVSENFSADHMVEKYLSVYTQLCPDTPVASING